MGALKRREVCRELLVLLLQSRDWDRRTHSHTQLPNQGRSELDLGLARRLPQQRRYPLHRHTEPHLQSLPASAPHSLHPDLCLLLELGIDRSIVALLLEVCREMIVVSSPWCCA